jgi:hypothetical protein
MIWDLETTDGANYAVLAAIHSRARRWMNRRCFRRYRIGILPFIRLQN